MAEHTPGPFAAAPEMLEALMEAERLLVLAYGEPPFNRDPNVEQQQPTRFAGWRAIDAARAAIAKATGETL